VVRDGASSHKAKDLPIHKNIRLLALPPRAPELNPQEHVWDELRKKGNSRPGIQPSECGHPIVAARLAADREGLSRLTAWPWIVSLNLNADYNNREPHSTLNWLTSANREGLCLIEML
jgi:hypothetical protein